MITSESTSTRRPVAVTSSLPPSLVCTVSYTELSGEEQLLKKIERFSVGHSRRDCEQCLLPAVIMTAGCQATGSAT